MAEADAFGQPRPAGLHSEPAGAENTQLLADNETRRNSQRQRRERRVQPRTGKGNAGIGEGEDRQDEEGRPRVQGMLEPFERPLFARRDRYEQRGHHPGQRRMDTGFEDADPQQRREQEIRYRPCHARAVQEQHGGGGDQRQRERGEIHVLGVEDRDDRDRADVVDDCNGEQQGLECHRNARTEQGQQAQREGDVGGGRDRPAAQILRRAQVERHEDDRRDRHAADCGDDG